MQNSFIHEYANNNIKNIINAYKSGKLNEIEKEIDINIIGITQNIEISITKRLIVCDLNEVKRICSYAIENPKDNSPSFQPLWG